MLWAHNFGNEIVYVKYTAHNNVPDMYVTSLSEPKRSISPQKNDQQLLVIKKKNSNKKSSVYFLQRKRSAVSGVKQEAQEVLGEGEHLLDDANQLSDNINKELEVKKKSHTTRNPYNSLKTQSSSVNG